MAEEAPNKADLLKHYSTKEPRRFVQIDAFDDPPADGFFQTDADGHGFTVETTYELMAGSTVRVLIKEGADKDTVLALLGKISSLIYGDPVVLDPEESWALVVRALIREGTAGERPPTQHARCPDCGADIIVMDYRPRRRGP